MALPSIVAKAAGKLKDLKVSPELAQRGIQALKVGETLLKPTDPSEGPPLPSSWDISWPGFIMRGIKRLREEPPWETIPKHGLREELRREFEVVTGRKIT